MIGKGHFNLRLVRRATVTGIVALAVATALAGSAKPSAVTAGTPSTGGVFILTYAPRPVHSGLSQMRVQFTTSGRAQSGWEYYVHFVIERHTRPRKPSCANRAASWVPSMVRRVQHISGVAGKTYVVWLRAAKSLGGHFCSGPAVLEVGTGPSGREGNRRLPLRQVMLRVLRAP